MKKSRLDFRVDAETRKALEAYAAETGVSLTAAARTLISIALRDLQSIDQAAHRRAVREGFAAGYAEFKKRMGEVFDRMSASEG